jgi:hypothetical protein
MEEMRATFFDRLKELEHHYKSVIRHHQYYPQGEESYNAIKELVTGQSQKLRRMHTRLSHAHVVDGAAQVQVVLNQLQEQSQKRESAVPRLASIYLLAA